jgi:hypothetical protein
MSHAWTFCSPLVPPSVYVFWIQLIILPLPVSFLGLPDLKFKGARPHDFSVWCPRIWGISQRRKSSHQPARFAEPDNQVSVLYYLPSDIQIQHFCPCHRTSSRVTGTNLQLAEATSSAIQSSSKECNMPLAFSTRSRLRPGRGSWLAQQGLRPSFRCHLTRRVLSCKSIGVPSRACT